MIRVRNVCLYGDTHVCLGVHQPHEHLHSRRPTRIARSNRDVSFRCRPCRVVFATAIWRWHPIDRREETEVIEAQRVTQCLKCTSPRSGLDPHPDVVTWLDDHIFNSATQRSSHRRRERITRRVHHGRGLSCGRQLAHLAFRPQQMHQWTWFPRHANAHPCPRS